MLGYKGPASDIDVIGETVQPSMTKRFIGLSILTSALFLSGIAINLASSIVEDPLQGFLGTRYATIVILSCLLSAVAAGLLAYREFRQEYAKGKPVVSNTPVIHGFGKVWSKVKHKVGIPPTSEDIEKGAELTFQRFQRGFMILVAGEYDKSCDGTYVFFEHRHECYVVTHALPEFDTDALDRSVNKSGIMIDRRFSSLYWRLTSLRVQERLGLPKEVSFPCFGAYQRFEHGVMIWVQKTNDIYVVYSDGENNAYKWLEFRSVRWWDYRS